MWKYNKKDLDENDIPKTSIGFIYKITQISTGKIYIGRKILFKTVTRTKLGKKRKEKVDSDWRTYWSSSPKIKAWIETDGIADFTKEILLFVSSKGMLAYGEELAMYLLGVLESDKFLNDNIRSKIYRTWVKPDEALALRKILEK
jgi:hypothetical protein